MMTSIKSQKEIPGWQKVETRVTCPVVPIKILAFLKIQLAEVSCHKDSTRNVSRIPTKIKLSRILEKNC